MSEDSALAEAELEMEQAKDIDAQRMALSRDRNRRGGVPEGEASPIGRRRLTAELDAPSGAPPPRAFGR
jgi:hypothetical protein